MLESYALLLRLSFELQSVSFAGSTVQSCVCWFIRTLLEAGSFAVAGDPSAGVRRPSARAETDH